MQNADILSLAQLRLDGRKYNEIRRIKTKMGVVDRADGSAYYEQVRNFSSSLTSRRTIR